MTKQRENNRWISERRDSEGRLLCLVPNCNSLREKGKNGRIRNYCSVHTFYDMQAFTSFAKLRAKVLKRDNHTCVKCGDTTREIEVEVSGWYSSFKRTVSNFVADHITPIALGGDEWDINNLQTLCQKCNKIKTAKDIKDIALLRKMEIMESKGQITIIESIEEKGKGDKR